MIAVVGLLVIGPDKLPGVARTAGMWLGRFRRFVGQVKTDIDRELRQEELKKALERNAGLDEMKQILNDDFYSIEDEKKPDYQVKAVSDDEFDDHTDLDDEELDHSDLAGLDKELDHTDLADPDVTQGEEHTNSALEPGSVEDIKRDGEQ